jgi:thiol:disulfide interchange protein
MLRRRKLWTIDVTEVVDIDLKCKYYLYREIYFREKNMSQEQYYQTVQQGEQYFEEQKEYKKTLEILERDLEHYSWQKVCADNRITEIQLKINKLKELIK